METKDSSGTAARIDLPILDPQFKANPYALYDTFRDQGRSVIPVRLPTGVEAWLITDYATARSLLNDSRLSKVPAKDQGSTSHTLFQHLLGMDPPDHTRLRSIIAREFTSRRVNLLRSRIRDITVQLLDEFASKGETDLVQSFALPLPLKVICELLGIPATDIPRVQEWSTLLAAADLDDVKQIPLIAQELHDYLLDLAAKKRIEPDNFLYSALVTAHDGGELSENELASMAFLLLLAGHETSSNLIGNGVLALLRNPTEWSRLCANENLARTAVEELLRFESPLEVSTARYAKTEITIADSCIQEGDMVFVGLAAANRDPDCFSNANELDIGRDTRVSHLAFGYGIHFCVGAALARAEGEIAFTELSRRFPDLELKTPADQLEWTPGLIMRGLKNLPVRFKPQKASQRLDVS